MTDDDWMRQAIRLAAKAEQQGEVPVGALLVKDDKVLGEGWNQTISAQDPTAHAEIVALRDAGTAVLLVSVELDEIMSLSDRIAVMFDGQIMGFADPETTNERALGLINRYGGLTDTIARAQGNKKKRHDTGQCNSTDLETKPKTEMISLKFKCIIMINKTSRGRRR